MNESPIGESPAQLDPQLAELLRKLHENGTPELYTMDPLSARQAYSSGVQSLSGDAPGIRRCVDELIDAAETPIPVRLYFPVSGGREPPLVVYLHGGGWSFGSIETHDNVCRTLCAGASCIIASVDYRLAPENKFPAAVDDAITAVRWAFRHADRIGANTARIAVAGDSAGANLATVAALALRDEDEADISCQLLIYPATDQTMALPSHGQFGAGYRLTRPLMVWSSMNYLRDGRDVMDPRASPLFSNNLYGSPPAIVITAGFDPLRDEGAAYADKLSQSGVPVRYRCFESLTHGFIGLTGVVDAARFALDRIAVMLKEQF